jgi:homocysteine S-methyltransferase
LATDVGGTFERARREGRVLVVDGGLATELERRGVDISGPLWSARALTENPQAILRLHVDYLRAGAGVLVSASYQATLQAMQGAGFGPREARGLLLRSVELAREAGGIFAREAGRDPSAARPIVAASVGPYGAFLHDGSEYRGDYGLDVDDLVEFHAERFAVLAGSGADLLACETIPCAAEARALVRLLRRHPDARAWLSFSCADAAHLRSGERIAEQVARLDREPQVVALGVNCTAPDHVGPLISEIRGATTKPIVVYPNSGEGWDARVGRWSGEAHPEMLLERAAEWREAGATLIGGCCRVGPEIIRATARRLGD